MSTNDTVLMLARPSDGPPLAGDDLKRFAAAVRESCADLAQAIIRDAEGAAHFVTLEVRGLRTRGDAARIARAVADSALVKTAIAGNDPNWGRIVSAAGYAGVPFTERDVSLTLNGIPLYRQGTPADHDAAAVSQSMKSGQVHIDLEFSLGGEAVRFWTSDLTAEYVRLNSEYTT